MKHSVNKTTVGKMKKEEKFWGEERRNTPHTSVCRRRRLGGVGGAGNHPVLLYQFLVLGAEEETRRGCFLEGSGCGI